MKIIYTYWIFLPEHIGGICLFYLVIFLRKIVKKCFILLTTHKKIVSKGGIYSMISYIYSMISFYLTH